MIDFGSVEPDTKDWTWVLEEPCPDCGFDAGAVRVEELPELIGVNARGWHEAFAHHDATVRPAPNIWSTLEYGCHVRDVHLLFADRVRLMLTQDDPEFANWDQDVTAVEQGYAAQQPEEVLTELTDAAAAVAEVYAGVAGDQWDRAGRRSNGSVFTVASLGRYHLHDAVHHLYDVSTTS